MRPVAKMRKLVESPSRQDLRRRHSDLKERGLAAPRVWRFEVFELGRNVTVTSCWTQRRQDAYLERTARRGHSQSWHKTSTCT